MPELRPGEVAVDQLHLGLLAFARLARAGDVDQRLAQRDRDRKCAFGFRDPDAIEKIEVLYTLRHRVGDDERYIGTGLALVLAQLRKPALAEILGALRLPQDRAARLA